VENSGRENFRGSAILEQQDTTTFIYPNQEAYGDEYRNNIVEIE